MKKDFDCVEMKQRAQERILSETAGLSREEELAYFRRSATQFWEEIRKLRELGHAAELGSK